MTAKLFNYSGDSINVDIPSGTDKIIGVVLTGDMVMVSPFYKDSANGRKTDYYDGTFSIPTCDFDRLNAINNGLESSYDVLSIWGVNNQIATKSNRFDPKELNPFDKVLIRHDNTSTWNAALFSHFETIEGKTYAYAIPCNPWNQCIPYNDETKHLIGTTDDCPEYYKWWEA